MLEIDLQQETDELRATQAEYRELSRIPFAMEEEKQTVPDIIKKQREKKAVRDE